MLIMQTYASKRKSLSSFWLFLIGLFGATQIVIFNGAVGISELFVFLVAPYWCYYDWRQLKYDGFGVFLKLVFAVLISSLVSSWVNDNFYPFKMIKVVMLIYSIFAFTVVLHRLLRSNLAGIRWLLLGLFLSMVIKIFAFDPSVTAVDGHVVIAEHDGISSLGGEFFWAPRFSALGYAVFGGWGLSVPHYLSILYYGLMIVVVASTTVSGRSALSAMILGLVLYFIGGRTSARMRRFSKSFVLVLLAMMGVGFVVKRAYSYAALNGLLGDVAYRKYQVQTEKGDSLVKILMSGRVEFFVSVRALLDQPIWGYGCIPVDKDGYMEQFIYKYGTPAEIAAYNDRKMHLFAGAVRMLPTHSHLTGFWAYYGLVGGILWLYVLWELYRYLTRYAAALPRFFPYLALVIPSFVWDIFFSPYTNRIAAPLIMVCVLLTKAAWKGHFMTDPKDMGFVALKRNPENYD